jgi:hypothetical protein
MMRITRCWKWAACLTAALLVCGLGCQPSASQGTSRTPSMPTVKQPDTKKPVEPPADPG